MDDTNIWVGTGRLVANPEYRETNKGKGVLDFVMACNRYKTKPDSDKSEQLTTFVKVTSWNKQAENLRDLLFKGAHVLVRGQLVDDNFEKDGKRTNGRIKIDNCKVELLDRAEKNIDDSWQEEVENF